eukprot:CAMPEP_0113658954 /NCGR_PEP_ID=MMETSP0017_2-20120614/32058_1 /TAXON_ID=2856 /ORGANISM="Cylindrotheca closterium" /LENGTH=91 /DNA_ID=CAMNT_0000573389 /DNA_START=190 /DNA_END=462 /DNA_ORIENTATION=- /assembly_acc=CAM_ASM_000147
MHTTLNDLSLFDPYLLGEAAKLQHLDLQWSDIGEEDIIQFASKLPNMKTLRILWLGRNSFQFSISALTSLLEAVLKSKSLEFLDLVAVPQE